MGNLDGRIARNERLKGDYWLLEIALEGDFAPPQPGRFLMLRVAPLTDPLLRRPFGIHDWVPRGGGSTALRILYRCCGRGTRLMTELPPGARADILGPLGRGYEFGAAEAVGAVLVAGGIGAAPLLYLARRMAGAGLRPRVYLGGNSSADLLGAAEFRGLGLEVSEATMDGSRGRRGSVVDALLAGEGKGRETSVFACGPAAMLRTLAGVCRGRGWPMQASVDARMACGLGLCLGCAVPASGAREKYLMACREGPVFGLEEIVWADLI